jgi:quercetin dioxygenase-like cupin family protein
MSFFDTGKLKQKQVLEGITLRSVAGDKAMMTFFEFEGGAVIPSHSHPHEQITYVLEGEIEFTLKGEARLLTKGQGVVIRANEEHSARVIKGPARAVDAWHPLREDYRL